MKKHYTKDELDKMVQLKREGASYEEIARMFNRTPHAVQQKLSTLGTRKDNEGSSEEAPKRKPLDDYQPREIIKYLYNLGYRIKDNKLVFIYEQVVNMKSVLGE